MKKNGKSLYVAALLLFLGGMGYLLFSGISENSMYFLTVAEAKSLPQNELESARLFGVVHEKGLLSLPDGPGASFLLRDAKTGNALVRVAYHGILPDAFKEGAEVIVEGGLAKPMRADGFALPVEKQIFPEYVFAARVLMTQCPSKYEKKNR